MYAFAESVCCRRTALDGAVARASLDARRRSAGVRRIARRPDGRSAWQFRRSTAPCVPRKPRVPRSRSGHGRSKKQRPSNAASGRQRTVPRRSTATSRPGRTCRTNAPARKRRSVRVITTDRLAEPVVSAIEAPPPREAHRVESQSHRQPTSRCKLRSPLGSARRRVATAPPAVPVPPQGRTPPSRHGAPTSLPATPPAASRAVEPSCIGPAASRRHRRTTDESAKKSAPKKSAPSEVSAKEVSRSKEVEPQGSQQAAEAQEGQVQGALDRPLHRGLMTRAITLASATEAAPASSSAGRSANTTCRPTIGRDAAGA